MRKLKTIHYVPFKILRKDQQQCFRVGVAGLNEGLLVNNLKSFEPSLLDNEPEKIISLVDDLHIDRETNAPRRYHIWKGGSPKLGATRMSLSELARKVSVQVRQSGLIGKMVKLSFFTSSSRSSRSLLLPKRGCHYPEGFLRLDRFNWHQIWLLQQNIVIIFGCYNKSAIDALFLDPAGAGSFQKGEPLSWRTS